VQAAIDLIVADEYERCGDQRDDEVPEVLEAT
jgi:hypothetical protein